MRVYILALPGIAAFGLAAAAIDCDRLHHDRFETEAGMCSTSFSIDIPVVQQEVLFTINESSPPSTEFESGLLLLRDLDSGDEVVVGDSSSGDGQYSIRVIPGAYRAFWQFQAGGALVPMNAMGDLGGVIVDGQAPLEIDMTRVALEGEITLDGQAPPASDQATADLYLRNFLTGDAVLLGRTHWGNYSRLTVPGEYQLVYEVTQGGVIMPRNKQAVIATVEIPDLTEVIVPLDVDLRSGTVWGNVRFNGVAPPADLDDSGRIRFVDTQTGDSIMAGSTANGSYQVRVLTGTYDIVYQAHSPGAFAPVNSGAVLIEDFVVGEGSQQFDLDIEVVELETRVTLQGAVPPASALENGRILLQDPLSGDEALLGLSSENDGVLATRVIPGDYEVVWALENGGSMVPSNLRAVLQSVRVEAGVELDVDVPVTQVAGAFLLDGVPAPASFLETADIRLAGAQSPDSVFLGASMEGDYQRLIVPGHYRVDYRLVNGGSQVPRNEHSIFGEMCIPETVSPSAVSRDIHIRSSAIAGGFFMNGTAPPDTAYETGRVLLIDPVTGRETLVGETHTASFNIRVLPGHYEVYYALEAGGGFVPRNSRARVGTFRVCP